MEPRKRIVTLAFLVLCLFLMAVTTPAQEKPDAPKPKHDSKIFWLGSAALAAANTFDAVETRAALNRGAYESNPIFGRYPSPAKQGIINAAVFAGQVLVFRTTERSKHAWVRWTGRALVSFATEEHVRYGLCDKGVIDAGRGACHVF